MDTPLNAGDICTRVVTTANPQMSVIEAARLMRERHVGCLVVVDEGQDPAVPIGVLTDRDIVTAIVAKDVDVRPLRVEDVMTADPATAGEAASISELLALMRRKGVRRVPIVGPQRELLGLVALDDVLEIVSEEMQAVVAAIGSEQLRERAVRR